MKKFIIVIVFVFLIAILISFNYLLWDREKQLESFQDISDSKNLTIETLSEKMNNLDKQNKELNTQKENLEKEKAKLTNSVFTLENENDALIQKIAQGNELILILKKTMDTEPINIVLKQWVEAINAKNYDEAQAFISKKSNDATLHDDYKIKTIKIKSIEPYNELIDEQHLHKIQFKVVLEVDKPEDAKNDIFKTGENIKYFSMEFASDVNAWTILEMVDIP